MKNIPTFYLLLLLLFSNKIYANTDTSKTFVNVEEMATYKGGEQEIYKLISENLNYPESALKSNIGGKVVTQFTVDTAGKVRDVKIIEGINEEIDREAIRLINILLLWNPGIQNGRKS